MYMDLYTSHRIDFISTLQSGILFLKWRFTSQGIASMGGREQGWIFSSSTTGPKGQFDLWTWSKAYLRKGGCIRLKSLREEGGGGEQCKNMDAF